ncbi:MAG: hypothetical protein IT406_01165 [Candidatus Yanofskybacteria bacterium]|nr:hypothetical protein [Candidatus Yanofskybacteria bacterium]
MQTVLSEAKSRVNLLRNLTSIRPGMLFSYQKEGDSSLKHRFCIAIKQSGPMGWHVVELTRGNREKIAKGLPCRRTYLSLLSVSCMDIPDTTGLTRKALAELAAVSGQG